MFYIPIVGAVASVALVLVFAYLCLKAVEEEGRNIHG
jgi:hypothetical protein